MSRCRLKPSLLVCAMLFICVNAWAQEPTKDGRRLGLTFGYPSSSVLGSSGGAIGLVWQTSDRIAFRPEFYFTARFAGESESGHSTAVGIAVTVQRFLARKGSVRAYVGPRLAYSRSSTSSGGWTSTGSMYGAGATAGVQYDLTTRIAVRGEVGADYTYSRGTGAGLPPLTASSHLVSSRASLGLELYF